MEKQKKSPPTNQENRRWSAVLTAAVLFALAAGIAGASLALPQRVQRADSLTGMRERPNGGPGTNILLMGTDGRGTVTARERSRFRLGGAGCDCTDVLMLVHVSDGHGRVSVVGLPRDSYARIPAFRDPGTGQRRPARSAKINAAYGAGGAPLVVRTVEEMTDVRIDRYVQVDFRRFIDTVDALHGVEVCTQRPLRDTASGLALAPGRHLLGGGQALQYVRARHTDAAADFGRIQRQQRFLVAVLERLRTTRALDDPVRVARLGRALLGPGRAGEQLTVPQLVALAGALRQLRPGATEFATVAVGTGRVRVPGGGTAVVWDRRRAAALFARLRADRPLTAADPGARWADPPLPGGDPRPVRGSTLACR
ncbi:hypothetical protein GCM10018793_01650 [Streptomyces sulfonofaciens]|uniref:Cell envelope-related transcriptional attenuator domain-containing protein n=1 Tax=Streptomyces sulfonofaciens TaxID=68272 RepID=A0A919FNZ9_9ACTN|nr:LCP family protein [Streptomyces sulfonofaciens]GHH69344.1 hypothetical protein GCM10018793_01650 [Streptomyces sulfonofaciens]